MFARDGAGSAAEKYTDATDKPCGNDVDTPEHHEIMRPSRRARAESRDGLAPDRFGPGPFLSPDKFVPGTILSG